MAKKKPEHPLHELALEFRDHAQTVIARFGDKFAESPIQAFDWGRDTVQAAARLEVANDVLQLVKPGQEIDPTADSKVITSFERTALEMARFPSLNTSPLSNLVHHERASALAHFAARARERGIVNG